MRKPPLPSMSCGVECAFTTSAAVWLPVVMSAVQIVVVTTRIEGMTERRHNKKNKGKERTVPQRNA